ncbi:D-alanine--D-alanine ligase family protein [Aeromicrobium endophyticum]|uniref:D-alanine--D-alanine ligase n=1 Tax=Aeromicrobium endophyticum TaxID=2292704 RepID=A0A371PA34_9ACTN|nr:D-alanine--D-alanine ligase [Aeromicrobium endophyticum]REK72762.1 D-alanine--D-alanine ligase [Aeromicrobium endophyticum]
MSASLSVLVLAGSPVDEFHGDLSRVYASGFLSAMSGTSHRFQVAWVDPGGDWRFPDGLEPADVAAAPAVPVAEAVRTMAEGGFDVMVPQMFCLPGMTTYRSLFDLIGIPYVGNGPDLMALTADKSRARAIVSAAGVDVPRGVVVRRGDPVDTDLLPAVVKPLDADNSAGVTLVPDAADLDRAVAGALQHSDAALVESFVPLGREVRCGILVRDGELVCLPLEEYAVDDIRTPADKLDRTDDGDLYLVAKERTRAWIVPVDDPLTERVWAAARACHEALGCRHYSLFDFRIDPEGVPFFLEASLYCSYSPSSVVAVMAAAAGIDVVDLFDIALKELL